MKKILGILLIVGFSPSLFANYTHTIKNNTQNRMRVTAELDGTMPKHRDVEAGHEAKLPVYGWPTKAIKVYALQGPQMDKRKDKKIIVGKQRKSYRVDITYNEESDALEVKLL